MNKSRARNTVPEFYSGRHVSIQDKLNIVEVYIRDRKRVAIRANHPNNAQRHLLLDRAFEWACGWYIQNPEVLLRN